MLYLLFWFQPPPPRIIVYNAIHESQYNNLFYLCQKNMELIGKLPVWRIITRIVIRITRLQHQSKGFSLAANNQWSLVYELALCGIHWPCVYVKNVTCYIVITI